MPSKNPYYWNVMRLRALFGILYQEGEAVPGSHIRTIECSESFVWKIYQLYKDVDSGVTRDQVATALTLLGKMGVLDAGKRGSKLPGFTRKLNPSVVITEEGILAGRAR